MTILGLNLVCLKFLILTKLKENTCYVSLTRQSSDYRKPSIAEKSPCSPPYKPCNSTQRPRRSYGLLEYLKNFF